MLKPWWERWPGRLESELEGLEAAGIRYEIDEEERSKGRLRLQLQATVGGQELDLLVLFPDLYPYTRFDIRALNLALARHQNPFSKGLCLIGRATENWDSDSTLAQFITERIPLVIESSTSEDKDVVARMEEHQGEPFSEYYRYAKDAMVLVDSSWQIDPSVTGGVIRIGVEERTGEILRGAVIEVQDERGRVVVVADPTIARLYQKQIDCRWVRHHEPIRQDSPDGILEIIEEQNSRIKNARWKLMSGGINMDIVAVLFPEEHKWREHSDGWIFCVRLGRAGRRVTPSFGYLARVGRTGRNDVAERTPELRPLSERVVSIIGLGGLGGPSAIEFARCGTGALRVLDCDYVDPATACRWPLGISASGRNKADAIDSFVKSNYPYTKVLPYMHRVGAIREADDEPGHRSDLEILDELIVGADLIYDATAEFGIQHLLSDLAAERDTVYMCVSTTPGAWGGRIVRIRPGKTEGCWVCLMHWVNDGKIPSPPADPAGSVQPAGCADPTFTGVGFDVASIALGGVRLAASTLAEGAEGAYPQTDWDVTIISLRDEQGRLIAPKWETFTLERHPSCKNAKTHRKGVDIGSGS